MEPLLREPDGAKILHVDDEEPFLDLTRTFLQREADDLTVITETDPNRGLEHLTEERIDCIISDYDMPQMEGLTFLSEVRDYDQQVPFILFTGKGNEEVAAEAIEAGIDSYLRKQGEPAQFAVLANRIETLVERVWATRRAQKMEQTYELIAKTASDAFWIRNMETRKTLYSDGISKFGYEPGVRDDGFEWWVERVHPDDRVESRDLNALQREGARKIRRYRQGVW